MRIEIPFTLLACLATASLAPAPAHATLRAHTFVASTGVDNGTCSFSQPCRTLQGAYLATATGGEVTAIDTAGYGNLTISHSITITIPPGIEAGMAPASGADAVVVQAGSGDTVVLRGLTLEGGGGLNGRYGISLTSGGNLQILDCVIKDFQDGVIVAPTSGTTQVFIKNTTVLSSTSDGIHITPSQTASVLATINQATANFNSTGINVDETQTIGSTIAYISNSHAENNSTRGIFLNGQSNSLTAFVLSTTIVGNPPLLETDLIVDGAQNTYLSGSKIGTISGTTPSIRSDGTNFIFSITSVMLTSYGAH
jgi:hypothetical protein